MTKVAVDFLNKKYGKMKFSSFLPEISKTNRQEKASETFKNSTQQTQGIKLPNLPNSPKLPKFPKFDCRNREL